MGPTTFRTCPECDEPLTPNSAVYDDYGTPRWFCTNLDCPRNPVNRED